MRKAFERSFSPERNWRSSNSSSRLTSRACSEASSFSALARVAASLSSAANSSRATKSSSARSNSTHRVDQTLQPRNLLDFALSAFAIRPEIRGRHPRFQFRQAGLERGQVKETSAVRPCGRGVLRDSILRFRCHAQVNRGSPACQMRSRKRTEKCADPGEDAAVNILLRFAPDLELPFAHAERVIAALDDVQFVPRFHFPRTAASKSSGQSLSRVPWTKSTGVPNDRKTSSRSFLRSPIAQSG